MGATMSIQGDTSELVKRVFSNIDFAFEVFSFTRTDVFLVSSLGVPDMLCSICSCGCADTDNPIIICDAATECTGRKKFTYDVLLCLMFQMEIGYAVNA